MISAATRIAPTGKEVTITGQAICKIVDGRIVEDWFIKRDPRTGTRTHHIHMVEGDFSDHWDRLLFRDYLIGHPQMAREYAALKCELASAATRDRIAYTRGKTEFIVKVTEQAKQYFGRT